MVAHHDEQSLGPSHCHIEPLERRGGGGHSREGSPGRSTHQPTSPQPWGFLRKLQVKVQIQLHKAFFLAAPNGGDEDDAAFLALKLFPQSPPRGEEGRVGGGHLQWDPGTSPTCQSLRTVVTVGGSQERGQDYAVLAET